MATQVTNYKCPACTGPIHFDSDTGKLTCDYCGSSYEVAQMEALYAQKEQEAAQEQKKQEERRRRNPDDWDYSNMTSDWGAEANNMRAYGCPSCGAELICDATTAATSCPYCGNPTIVPGQFSGVLKPDFVIPFKLDKEDAKAALKRHYKGKKLLPKSFSSQNHIEEIKGVYVPFWLFDGQVEADIECNATNTTVTTSGDERITRTAHFRLRRKGTVDFARIPADGSSKMPDGHMDSIEPFDYNDLKPFSTAYLPGYLADKYDVTAEECARRADDRAKNTARDTLLATARGYGSVIPTREDYQLHRGAVQYALLPVWMLNTKWNGQNYLFAMNGQTGKLVGDLPMSWKRFWGWFAGLTAGLTAVLGVVLTLIF